MAIASHRVGAENSVTSCDLYILMNEAAEPIPSQWPNGRAGARGSATRGRVLVKRSVRVVSVEMVDVLAQHCGEVPWCGDQEAVEAFAPKSADPASSRGCASPVGGIEGA